MSIWTPTIFVPIAVETLGVMGPEVGLFFRDLGRQIAVATSEPLSHQYQCGNAVLPSLLLQRGALLLSASSVIVKHSCFC